MYRAFSLHRGFTRNFKNQPQTTPKFQFIGGSSPKESGLPPQEDNQNKGTSDLYGIQEGAAEGNSNEDDSDVKDTSQGETIDNFQNEQVLYEDNELEVDDSENEEEDPESSRHSIAFD